MGIFKHEKGKFLHQVPVGISHLIISGSSRIRTSAFFMIIDLLHLHILFVFNF